MEENNKKESKKELYSDINGIGPLSTLIFTLIITAIMYIVSRFIE